MSSFSEAYYFPGFRPLPHQNITKMVSVSDVILDSDFSNVSAPPRVRVPTHTTPHYVLNISAAHVCSTEVQQP